MAAGYRVYKKLAPGPWFNSVGVEEYYPRYRTEILGPLNPRAVVDELTEMAAGRIPVLLCFETPNGGSWCHRAMAAEWLAEALGRPVAEFGYEDLPQHRHPLMPAALQREIARRRFPTSRPTSAKSLESTESATASWVPIPNSPARR